MARRCPRPVDATARYRRVHDVVIGYPLPSGFALMIFRSIPDFERTLAGALSSGRMPIDILYLGPITHWSLYHVQPSHDCPSHGCRLQKARPLNKSVGRKQNEVSGRRCDSRADYRIREAVTPPSSPKSRERLASSKLAAPYLGSRRGEIPFSRGGQQRGDENLVLTGFRRSRAMRRYSNDTASLSDWPLPWGGGS